MEELNGGISVTRVALGDQELRVALRPVEHAEGYPLLIFNGIGANLDVFSPFIQALPGRDVIIFDAPGVGGSPTPKLPYRFPALARLSARLLDHFEFDQVDVLGVSWGGALAQVFAREFPSRCRRLILAATSSGSIMVPGELSVLWKLSSPRRYFQREYLDSVAHDLYGGDFRDQPDLIKEFTAKLKPGKSSRLGYYWQLAAGWGWTSIHWLHKLQQPTLILAGEDDPIIPLANAKLMHARIPNSRLVTIDCGHLFLFTRIKLIAPLVQEFLSADDPLYSMAQATAQGGPCEERKP